MAYYLAHKLHQNLLRKIQLYNINYRPDIHTPIYLVRKNSLDGLKYIEALQPGITYSAKWELLEESCCIGFHDLVKYLISLYFDGVDRSDGVERSTFYYYLYKACENGHFYVVKILVSAGTHYNKKEICCPLRIACYSGHLYIVKYLLSKGFELPSFDLCRMYKKK